MWIWLEDCGNFNLGLEENTTESGDQKVGIQSGTHVAETEKGHSMFEFTGSSTTVDRNVQKGENSLCLKSLACHQVD